MDLIKFINEDVQQIKIYLDHIIQIIRVVYLPLLRFNLIISSNCLLVYVLYCVPEKSLFPNIEQTYKTYIF